jgi:hypothetical protein
MEQQVNNELISFHGESVAAVVDWLNANPPLWSIEDSKATGRGLEWDLGVNWQGALKLVRTGWLEGARDMNVALAAMPTSRGPAIEMRYTERKGRLSVGRFMAGNPHCLRDKRKVYGDVADKIVYMAVNICTSGGTDAQCIANYGAAVCAVIEQLEQSGKRVALSVHFITNYHNGGYNRINVGWTVKRPQEPLDMATVAYSVAHPTALRRIAFALMERTPKVIQSHGYGVFVNLRPSDLVAVPDGAKCIILNGMPRAGQCAKTPADALRHVEEEVSKAVALWKDRDGE